MYSSYLIFVILRSSFCQLWQLQPKAPEKHSWALSQRPRECKSTPSRDPWSTASRLPPYCRHRDPPPARAPFAPAMGMMLKLNSHSRRWEIHFARTAKERMRLRTALRQAGVPGVPRAGRGSVMCGSSGTPSIVREKLCVFSSAMHKREGKVRAR